MHLAAFNMQIKCIFISKVLWQPRHDKKAQVVSEMAYCGYEIPPRSLGIQNGAKRTPGA